MFEFVADMDSKSAFNWDMIHFVLTRDGQQLPLASSQASYIDKQSNKKAAIFEMVLFKMVAANWSVENKAI